MLDDILQFAAQTLVDNGRLSFWMPTANDQDQEIAVPTHPYMEVVSVSTQVFNKCTFFLTRWSLVVFSSSVSIYLLSISLFP